MEPYEGRKSVQVEEMAPGKAGEEHKRGGAGKS